MIRAVVLTVSDRVARGEAEDLSGPRAAELLEALGFTVTAIEVVEDGVASVATALRRFVTERVPLVMTTGGTGLAQRDLTPEATVEVIDRPVPGLVEAMRSATFGTNPHGMLSRAVAGIAGSTLIVNLPGSVKGVEESIGVIGPALSHGVELLYDPSSDHNA